MRGSLASLHGAQPHPSFARDASECEWKNRPRQDFSNFERDWRLAKPAVFSVSLWPTLRLCSPSWDLLDGFAELLSGSEHPPNRIHVFRLDFAGGNLAASDFLQFQEDINEGERID